MIVKGFKRRKRTEDVNASGFDAFELRLGDVMRGERATLGKSLLDVQRELKIKAAYIAAIENADPSAFDTPGFIAGFVRSYARYLNMDAEWAFEMFCRESGFATAHGMSAQASSAKPSQAAASDALSGQKDIFAGSATPFIPAGEAMFSRVEPGAIGSLAVLVALIGGLGFGGWTVLQEVQKVQLAPVEQTPTVVSDLDPLAGGTMAVDDGDRLAGFEAPSADALDRLYRPQALEVPILVARDAPISTLNPAQFGTFAPEPITQDAVIAGLDGSENGIVNVQVNEGPVPEVQLVAARPAWVRVRAADGSVIFQGILDSGDTFALPATENPATLRVGESGAIYFAVNGVHYGPAGRNGTVTSNLDLSPQNLTETYAQADIEADAGLLKAISIVAEVAPE